MNQNTNQTIELIFAELREIGLDANTEFVALLLQHFGEHRVLQQVHKEALERTIYWFNRYKQIEEALQQVKAELAVYKENEES